MIFELIHRKKLESFDLVVLNFLQTNNGVFSYSICSSKLKASKNTISKSLKRLLDQNIIKIIQKSSSKYSTTQFELFFLINTVSNNDMVNRSTVSNNDMVKQLTISNIETVEKVTKNNLSKITSFNFKQKLIEAGCNKKTAEEFMKIRRLRKKLNTENSFKKLIKESEKALMTLPEVIELCVDKDWGRFESNFIQPNFIEKKVEHIHVNKKKENEWL